jgi:hypothetical protein
MKPKPPRHQRGVTTQAAETPGSLSSLVSMGLATRELVAFSVLREGAMHGLAPA